ncbi:copper chaperone PCu(A)C [Salipiger mucosus]|uniref:Copper metallochaperone n=1 Tax=Salipiger mucosus DSM 16094 TaxID=1123237 RepID=S9S5E8_9RHOB|nr:copper chaperone PCu(A)C [Salipiger mucosus]EPX85420.1 Copper metallochaperone [Salipiger mucosus DSM 16094]
MKIKSAIAGALGLALATPAAADIVISDAYARSAMPGAKTGAAFMQIENTGAEDDRLVAVDSEAAMKVELHTHVDMGDGVVKMTEVEEGFAIPAGGHHMLARGGDHVMFMGVTQPFEHGGTVTVTLTFEKAGERVVDIPVDLERQPDHGAMSH